MRIIGGAHRGRAIAAPKGMATRPTTDRVRESIFNILSHRDDFSFEGARVIDLFAGSGALGFEALSRGASFCLFVDSAAAARGAIRENQEAMALMGCTRIHRRSATHLGPKPVGLGDSFSLAFLDPPYGDDLAAPALVALRDGDWLSSEALCVIEQGKGEEPPAVEGYHLDDERTFGDTIVRFVMKV